MDPGTQVRLKADPGRIGFYTGKTRERAGALLLQVRFPNHTQYVPEDQLETVLAGSEDPLDLLEAGKVGGARDLRRGLTHVRLSGRLADLLYSMEVTNTDFYAYQFKPVIKMLNSPSSGLLIADEVGLGKTIESGLIWTELRSRFDLRRLMILCPAMLQEKWHIELANRFGMEAQIADATEALRTLRNSARGGDDQSFVLICSQQGLRPRKGWDKEETTSPSARLARFLEAHEHENPLIDLLVIDESHHLRNPGSKTAMLGRLLRNVAEYVLLLSATPIHLRSQDLFQLLNLLDEDTFSHPNTFDTILQANAPLIRAREAVLSKTLTTEEFVKLIGEARSHPVLQDNRQLANLAKFPPSSEELCDPSYRSSLASKLDTINILGHVLNRTRKREVTEWRVIRQPVPEAVRLTESERLFYNKVTQMVREFCAQCDYHEGFLLVTPQRQMSSSMPAALREWKQRRTDYLEQLEEDLGIDIDEEPGPLTSELIRRADELGDIQVLWEEDSKFKRLLEVLEPILARHRNAKVVLFSYFRATLDYLHERLSSHGIRCIKLMGSPKRGPRVDKTEVQRQFQSPKGPNVLLSSEVGSEGIDLQFSSTLINYDLPWNPMKLEQRIGRLDRLGQKAEKVTIWNLFYEGTIDSRIYGRLYERLNIFKHALGGLEPVLGDEIRKLTYELLSQGLTPEQEAERIEQRAQALANIRDQEERLENEAAHLVAYGDYILNQVKAAQELKRWIDGKDIETYIRDFFNLYYRGCEFRQSMDDEKVVQVRLTNEAKHDLEQYLRQHRIQTPTLLTRNNPDPVRCVFENKIALQEAPRTEVIHQTHPLVRFVSHSLEERDVRSHPAVMVTLDSRHLPEPFKKATFVFSVQRWTVRGVVDIEKMFFSATELDGNELLLSDDDAERLVLAAAAHGEDWFEGKNSIDLVRAAELANDRCLAYSDEQYRAYVSDTKMRNEDRVDIQLRSLDKHLRSQIEKLEATRAVHLSKGRSSLVKATEGKIKALQNRVERRKLEIEDRRSLRASKEEVCVGVIRVF